jgi:hypothetical protein
VDEEFDAVSVLSHPALVGHGCDGSVDFVVAVVVGTAGRQLLFRRRMWPLSAWAEEAGAGVDRTDAAAACWEATEIEKDKKNHDDIIRC